LRLLSSDEKAIEGMPLKLLIVALVMGITIPSILAMWANVEKVQTENHLMSEMDYLKIRISQVYMSGLGNAITVELHLKSGLMTSIEYVLVGGGLETHWKSTIRWKLAGEEENLVLLDNGIPVCGGNGEAFELHEGHSSLYLKVKKKEDGLVYVEISAQD
jgi:hypothetical protein